jgi:hypothetical protein
LGLVGLLCFLIVVNQTIPLIGVNLAILAALGASMIYLSLLGIALNHFKSTPAE